MLLGLTALWHEGRRGSPTGRWSRGRWRWQLWSVSPAPASADPWCVLLCGSLPICTTHPPMSYSRLQSSKLFLHFVISRWWRCTINISKCISKLMYSITILKNSFLLKTKAIIIYTVWHYLLTFIVIIVPAYFNTFCSDF